jgi:hypothetical protein
MKRIWLAFALLAVVGAVALVGGVGDASAANGPVPAQPFVYLADSRGDTGLAAIDQLGTVDGALTHVSPPEVDNVFSSPAAGGLPVIARSADGKSVFVAAVRATTQPTDEGGTEVARLSIGSGGQLTPAGQVSFPFVPTAGSDQPGLLPLGVVSGPSGTAFYGAFSASNQFVIEQLSTPSGGGLAAGPIVSAPPFFGGVGLLYDAATASLYVAGDQSEVNGVGDGQVLAYAVGPDGSLASAPYAKLDLGADNLPQRIAIGPAGLLYVAASSPQSGGPTRILPVTANRVGLSAGTSAPVPSGGSTDLAFSPSGPDGPSLFWLGGGGLKLVRFAVAANGALTAGSSVTLDHARDEGFQLGVSDDGSAIYIVTRVVGSSDAGAVVTYRVDPNGSLSPSGEIDSSNAAWVGGVVVGSVCPGAPPANDRKFGVPADKASAAGGGCPLNVAVTGRLTLTSGLAHRSFRNPDVARFFSGVSPTSSEACQSGCTDLTVTVTDPSNRNKPVSGAEVIASVQPITAGLAPYPAGVHPGEGYLCNGRLVASASRCGNGSREVTDHTDDKGQIKLRYWAPGVLKPEQVLLTVKAKLPCRETSCPAGLKQGELTPNPTLTVNPNVVIGTLKVAKVAELDPEEARDLGDWTKDSSLKRLKEFIANHTEEEVLTTAIKVAFEKEAEGPIAIAALIKELTAVNKEEIGFMSLLLNKLNVRLRGLGIDTPNVVPQPGPLPGNPFLREVAADDGPFTIDDGGLTWQYGKELAQLPRIKTQTLHLRVYEVSYCQQGEECGPGYSGVLKHRYDGIHPYLYFDFHADRAPLVHEGERNTVQGVYSKSFIVPYNAEAWMRAQFGG